MRVNPYLNFNGNGKEAFEFYEKVFKTKIGHLMNPRQLAHGGANASRLAGKNPARCHENR
jgi:uncharacterized glyoxalase superfamily protein PhnB